MMLWACWTSQGLIAALTRLGELALAQGEAIELVLVGGALMVLVFETRASTQDVDVLITAPANTMFVRNLAKIVAQENNWPGDWLNDAVKGFMVGVSDGPVIFSTPGIVVRRPAIEQLLAMKLCAWRDDIDIADAHRLLLELNGTFESAWQSVEPFLHPGNELKAKFAFNDLWEAAHGAN